MIRGCLAVTCLTCREPCFEDRDGGWQQRQRESTGQALHHHVHTRPTRQQGDIIGHLLLCLNAHRAPAQLGSLPQSSATGNGHVCGPVCSRTKCTDRAPNILSSGLQILALLDYTRHGGGNHGFFFFSSP